MNEPKLFSVIRKADESGVSGTGRVVDGVLFHTGQVVICWRTDIDAAKHGCSSLGIYATWEDFKFIHIDSHPINDTEILWHDKDEKMEQDMKDYYDNGGGLMGTKT